MSRSENNKKPGIRLTSLDPITVKIINHFHKPQVQFCDKFPLGNPFPGKAGSQTAHPFIRFSLFRADIVIQSLVLQFQYGLLKDARGQLNVFLRQADNLCPSNSDCYVRAAVVLIGDPDPWLIKSTVGKCQV